MGRNGERVKEKKAKRKGGTGCHKQTDEKPKKYIRETGFMD